MKKYKWLNKEEAVILGFKPKEDAPGRKQNRYYLDEQKIEELRILRLQTNDRSFVETQKRLDKDGEIVSTIEKLQSKPIEIPDNFEIVKISTSKTTGQQWIQYKPKKDSPKDEVDFTAIIKKHVKPVKLKLKPLTNTESDFDTITFTDVHVGLDTNKNKNSMYAELWNRDSILETAKLIVNKTLSNRKSDILVVDDLGDLLDGFNALTTRGGHKLPQNMTNKEAFDCAFEFKSIILDGLVKYYNKIVFNNVCNDNHAGDFGYLLNQQFKTYAELKYKNVEITNHVNFISHYIVNGILFLISHGKDDSTLKFGFKPQLDSKQVEKIDQYIKHHNLYGQAKRIIFKKGDSHQLILDMAGSDDFDYYNYPAASPSSQWVQNNFKKGRRGFVIESFTGVDNTILPIFINR